MNLTPEGRIKAEAELAERTAKLNAEIAKCPHCKAAKTRAIRAGEPYIDMRGLGRRGECGKHRETRRLNYVTSPLSETYWAS